MLLGVVCGHWQDSLPIFIELLLANCNYLLNFRHLPPQVGPVELFLKMKFGVFLNLPDNLGKLSTMSKVGTNLTSFEFYFLNQTILHSPESVVI